jgi:cytoskeleton protein RodZ
VSHFGEELRKERVSRGIDLATISGSTKIVTRYLTALENDQFEVLPGGILSKGIVRNYARAVGLDETTWVDRFLTASSQKGLTENEEGWVNFVSNVGNSRPRAHGHSGMRLRWTGVFALLVVLVGLGWFAYRYVSQRVLASEIPRHALTSAAAASVASNTGQ